MKQKHSLPISLRGIPEHDQQDFDTITWYDAENDTLFFDSGSGSFLGGGSHPHTPKPRPFPSPGTSPCTDSFIAAKDQHKHSSPERRALPIPMPPPAPPVPAYPYRSSSSIPSNVKITTATIASELSPMSTSSSRSSIPVTATIVHATEVPGSPSRVGWGSPQGGGGGGGGGGGDHSRRVNKSASRRNSASRNSKSYRNRSGSAPTINYASVAMATVLDYPSAYSSAANQHVYTATAIESPMEMDLDPQDHDEEMDDTIFEFTTTTTTNHHQQQPMHGRWR